MSEQSIPEIVLAWLFDNRLEVAANVFNLLSVWLSARNNIHTWWAGIVGCALYGVLFFDSKLYADVTLQVFFIGSCIAGWWNWLHGGRSRAALPITSIRAKTAVLFGAIAIAATGIYGTLLHGFTDASFPYIDSTVLALSILAQLLMMARKIASWPVWFIVDLIAAPLYVSKSLWLTATVYAVFLVPVVMGWLHWRQVMREQEHAQDTAREQAVTAA